MSLLTAAHTPRMPTELTRPHLRPQYRWVLVLVMTVSLLCSVLAFAGHHHAAHDNDSHCELCLATAHLGGAPAVVVPTINITPDAPWIVTTIDTWHDSQPRHHTHSRAPPLA